MTTRYAIVDYTPTVSVSSAVIAGDIISATEAIGNTRAGWLDTVNLYNLADVQNGFVLYLYNANVSVGAESAAFSPSDTATDNLLTIITFSSGGYVDMTNNLFIQKTAADNDKGMGVYLEAAAPGTDASIYAAMTKASTGVAYTTGSVKLKFIFKEDF